jgi:hypothetical protein
LRRELVDASLALRGLLGSSDTQIKLRSEIELLQVDSGKTGRGICVQVANAVMHDSYFKGLLQTYQQVIPVLIQLQPEYARFAELFKIRDTSNVSKFAKCLIDACKVVSTFASEPSTPLYVEFQKMVAKEAQTFFGDSHAKVLADLRVDTENIGRTKETMGHLSACLSEVGIVFPMESWVSEVSEEHSNILKQTDSTQLSVKVCCAMEDMTSCVWESRKPPDANRLRDFESSFSKAVPGMHFQDDLTQAKMLCFVSDMTEWSKEACHEDWAPLAAAVRSMAEFLKKIPPTVSFVIGIYKVAHAVNAALRYDVGSLKPADAWQLKVGPLLRAMEKADKYIVESGTDKGALKMVVDERANKETHEKTTQTTQHLMFVDLCGVSQ